MNRNKIRFLMSVIGVLFSGLSVGFFKLSQFGTDPFQCLMAGIYNVINIDFGLLYIIINLLILLIVFILDKHFIGIGTIINLFLVGYVVDLSYSFLQQNFNYDGLVFRIISLIIGFTGLCFGSSIYFTANMGVSTYDALSLHMANKNIAPFKFCRILTDLICVTTGVLLGGVAGLGTIITAFFMGPLINYFNNIFSKPLLNKYSNKYPPA